MTAAAATKTTKPPSVPTFLRTSLASQPQKFFAGQRVAFRAPLWHKSEQSDRVCCVGEQSREGLVRSREAGRMDPMCERWIEPRVSRPERDQLGYYLVDTRDLVMLVHEDDLERI